MPFGQALIQGAQGSFGILDAYYTTRTARLVSYLSIDGAINARMIRRGAFISAKTRSSVTANGLDIYALVKRWRI